MPGDVSVIRSQIHVTGVFTKTADTADLARPPTDLNPVRDAGVHSVGVISFQLTGGLRQIFIGTGTHRIHKIVILFT